MNMVPDSEDVLMTFITSKTRAVWPQELLAAENRFQIQDSSFQHSIQEATKYRAESAAQQNEVCALRDNVESWVVMARYLKGVSAF